MPGTTPLTTTSTSVSSTPRHNTIAARVTAHIREALARGVKPWVQPFTQLPPPLPLRSTGEPYRGSNIILLWAAALNAGFLAPTWYTFKQAAALGAHVRRGERGTLVTLYKPRDATSAEGAPTAPDDTAAKRGAILRSFTVFNADQIDGLRSAPTAAAAPPSSTSNAAQHALTQLARVPAQRIPAARAFYRPATDTVHMPPAAAFLSPAHRAATLAHELAHWTGHASRLNRPFLSHAHDPRAYAREELVAELTSAFVGAELGLPVTHLDDHSAYLAHWLNLLTDEPHAFLTAAAQAQRAADYLRTLIDG